MHLRRKYVERGLNQLLKFQEGQEVSMRSILNLGGLGHAPRKIFKIVAVRLHLEQLLCDMVDKLFNVKT